MDTLKADTSKNCVGTTACSILSENKKCGKCYTLYLEPDEISNPLIVLADFFSDDWLPCQLDWLREWRDYVLKDDYYRDQKGSPVGLLNFYKHTIKLIEATWLLKQSGNSLRNTPQVMDLAIERNTWRDFPVNLSNAELINPYHVIDDFFETIDMLKYREELYEWLEHGLSKNGAKEFIETRDFISVYENLQKLFSAAWMIYQRNGSSPYLKDFSNLKFSAVSNWIAKEAGNRIKVYQLNNEFCSTVIQELIAKVISIIKYKVPSVQAVIYLGKASEYRDKFYLLVLTSNDETQQAQNIAGKIEDCCSGVANVMALVHHASCLFTGIEKNNRFFIKALHCPVIYLSGDFILPVAKSINLIIQSEENVFDWDHWYGQAKDFFCGADFYRKNGAYNPALFSLHQCVECLLIALVRGVLGYRINNHNLSRLMNLTGMFTKDLIYVSNWDDEGYQERFKVLKHAYMNVRYKDKYETDSDTVDRLYQIVSLLLPVAEQVYKLHHSENSL
jgi:HEPN domain-containing protein